jgi:hypothetical protein
MLDHGGAAERKICLVDDDQRSGTRDLVGQ